MAPEREMSRWRAGLAHHLGSNQVSRIVYGSIIGLALVAAYAPHPPSNGVMVGSLVATGVAVALAELYSEILGARARAGLGGHVDPLGLAVEDAVAVAFGTAFPAVFFLAGAIGLMDQHAAFTWAKWTGIGLIAGYGYAAARLSGAPVRRAIVEATGVALIGALLISVKSVLH